LFFTDKTSLPNANASNIGAGKSAPKSAMLRPFASDFLREAAPFALMAAPLAWLYLRLAAHLGAQWWRDPNYSHGFFVPLLALWMLWNSRCRLMEAPKRPSWWGLVVILAGLSLLVIGTFGADLYLSRVSFLFVIAGMAIFFYGWPRFRVGMFAWLVLFLMIPLPLLVSNQIVLPLQFISSALATGLMDLFGIPVFRQGNVIFLPSLTLEVAEACSGIRSLMAMVTLAVAFSYLAERKAWKRAVLVFSAIPVAIVANGIRIMASGVLGYYWSHDKAEGFFHLFSGIVIFTFAFLILWMLDSILRRVAPGDRPESAA
jgi:exosortase